MIFVNVDDPSHQVPTTERVFQIRMIIEHVAAFEAMNLASRGEVGATSATHFPHLGGRPEIAASWRPSNDLIE